MLRGGGYAKLDRYYKSDYQSITMGLAQGETLFKQMTSLKKNNFSLIGSAENDC